MEKSARAVRIVMVDDDPDDLFLTEISFRKANFPVEFSGLDSANSLFNYIKDKGIGSIDVLLLDLNMPKMNGHEFLAEMRTEKSIKGTVVFVLTSSELDEDIKKSYDQFVAGFFLKHTEEEMMDKNTKLFSEYYEKNKFKEIYR